MLFYLSKIKFFVKKHISIFIAQKFCNELKNMKKPNYCPKEAWNESPYHICCQICSKDNMPETCRKYITQDSSYGKKL